MTLKSFLGNGYISIPSLILITGILSFGGVLSGNKIVLLLLNFLFPYLLMVYLVRRKKLKRAIAYMLIWAVAIGVFMSLWCYAFPDKAQSSIIHGSEYKEEMFHWIRTGIGAESTPSLFIPQHLRHLAIFLICTVLTAGIAGIAFGVILMDYMAFYVGELINHTTNPLLASLMGWHTWSIFRVFAFVLLGVIFTKFSLNVIIEREFRFNEIQLKATVLSVILLLVDIVMKTLLAPFWQRILKTIFTG